MTATNHVVTGALLAAAIPHPLICLPLAFLSHFLLDIIPHSDMNISVFRRFVITLAIDLSVAATILLVLLVTQPAHYWLLIFCGVVSASPDLLYVGRFINLLKRRTHKMSMVERFTSGIQWSETTWGFAVEAIWFVTMGSLLLTQIK